MHTRERRRRCTRVFARFDEMQPVHASSGRQRPFIGRLLITLIPRYFLQLPAARSQRPRRLMPAMISIIDSHSRDLRPRNFDQSTVYQARKRGTNWLEPLPGRHKFSIGGSRESRGKLYFTEAFFQTPKIGRGASGSSLSSFSQAVATLGESGRKRETGETL